MQEAAGRVAAAARAHGKAAAVFLGDPALAPTYRELGFTLISAGFTSPLLAGATDAILRALRRDLTASAVILRPRSGCPPRSPRPGSCS